MARKLAAHPASCDALAELLGCDGTWASLGAAAPRGAELLGGHPQTARALETLLAAG